MNISKLTIFTLVAVGICGSASAQTCIRLSVAANSLGVTTGPAGDFTEETGILVSAPALLPGVSNTVSLASDDAYETDADGVITKAPTAGTGAFTFFSASLPVGPPLVGQKKTPGPGQTATLSSAPYGALVGGFVPIVTGGIPTDWFLIGTAATLEAPPGGSRLVLAVNDNNRADNSKAFLVTVTRPINFSSKSIGLAFGPFTKGQGLRIEALGNIVIAIQEFQDRYAVDANGTITQAPPAGTPTSTFFSTQLPPGAPTVGSQKRPTPDITGIPLSTAPWGSVVGCFSVDQKVCVTPVQPLGAHFNLTTGAPADGQFLILMVNDNNLSDNFGSFQVAVIGTDLTCLAGAPTLAPALFISKTHTGNFSLGQEGVYTIGVTNSGTAPTLTTPLVQLLDTPPAGMTITSMAGTGWDCNIGAQNRCARGDSLPAGNSYPSIRTTVNVAANATSPLTNVVTAQGGGSVGTVTGSDPTILGAAGPALSLTKTHTGNLPLGGTGTYTLTVTNSGTSATVAGPTVKLVDTPPSGMTITAIAGTGWTCSVAPSQCTRTDALPSGQSYPPVTVTVQTAATAATPLTNVATLETVGVEGIIKVSDLTAIGPPGPALSLTKTHSGNFTQGQTGTYTLTVGSIGTVATTAGVLVQVIDAPPAGMTVTAMTGTGWTCTVGAQSLCNRGDSLAVGQSYPPITATVSVATTASTPLVNTATAQGGGTTVTVSVSDSTVIAISGTVTGNPVISQVADGGAFKSTLLLTNAGTQAAPFTLRFWGDAGLPASLGFNNFPAGAQLMGTVAPSGLNTIEGRAVPTDGTTVAWADMVASGAIGGVAILRQRVPARPDFEASIPLTPPVASRLLIPFDNTSGFTTTLALANPGSAAVTVTVVVHDVDGTNLPTTAPIALPGMGHTAFSGPDKFPSSAGRRGVLELTTGGPLFSAIAFRFNDSGAFTTLNPVADIPKSTAPQTISQIVEGGAFKSTILLTNTGAQAAPFTLRFWQDSGAPLPLSFNGGAANATFTGSIAPNGLAVVDSAGNPAVTTLVGWADLVTTGAVGGVAVIRQRVPNRPDFEAGVPVASFQGRVLAPFDNTSGFTTSMAIASPGAQPITVNVTSRDESGQVIATETPLNLLPQGHQSFTVPTNFPKTAGRRGILEFSSPGNAISAIVLRFADSGAFTSLNPVAGQ